MNPYTLGTVCVQTGAGSMLLGMPTPRALASHGHGDGAKLLMMSFPAPAPCGGRRASGVPRNTPQDGGQPTIAAVFSGPPTKKSSGPNGTDPLAIRCLYGWVSDAVIRIENKITKPGSDNCVLAKSYGVISLLNRLGKWRRWLPS